MAEARYTYAVGRRKTSTAQVKVYKGKGDNKINGVKLEDFCSLDVDKAKILKPFVITENLGEYYFEAVVKGGGFSGQIGAIVLGISRALVKINEDYKSVLKKEGLMTRDPRMKERKKPYTRGARRGKQFSKR